jgi:hypothetical protein
MSPLGSKSQSPFRVSFGTDESQPPKVTTVAKDADLMAIEDYVRQERGPLREGIPVSLFYIFVGVAVTQMIFVVVDVFVLRRRNA